MSLVLDATEGVDSCRTGGLIGEDGEATTAEPTMPCCCLLLSSELKEERALFNLLALPSRVSSTGNRRASNRAAVLRSCNVLRFSRPLVVLVAALMPPLRVVTPVIPLAAPEMVLRLSREWTEVLLLMRDSLAEEVDAVEGVSDRPRADLAAWRLECFCEEDDDMINGSCF